MRKRLKTLQMPIVLCAMCVALIGPSTATAFDFSTCDPTTDRDACECPSGATDCYEFDANDIPDFRNGTYSTTSWISIAQNDPNSDRYTVTFDLSAAPGHGIVRADDNEWSDVQDATDFIANLTGIPTAAAESFNFNIVQKGQSAQVDANGQETSGSSPIWLMNVLTNSSGLIEVDGTTYDPANAPVNIDGVDFPGGPSFFLANGQACSDLIAIDDDDNLWEAKQCTTLDNISLSANFSVYAFKSRSSITELTRNGIGSTIEVDGTGSVPFFRLTKVETDLSESTTENVENGDQDLVIWNSLSARATDSALFVINPQFYNLHADSFYWARGECGKGEMVVPGGSDDTDLTSYGWYPGTETGCPESEGTE